MLDAQFVQCLLPSPFASPTADQSGVNMKQNALLLWVVLASLHMMRARFDSMHVHLFCINGDLLSGLSVAVFTCALAFC